MKRDSQQADCGQAPQRRTAFAWKLLLLSGALAAACKPTETSSATSPVVNSVSPDAGLFSQLNPVNLSHLFSPAILTAPPPTSPATVFPVPVRTWLPPAETSDAPRVLSGDLRISASALQPFAENPMLTALTAPPARVVLVVPPPEKVLGPDSAQLNTWVAVNPATETRGRPPRWDSPNFTTDPTSTTTRDLELMPPSGLRETPPPFVPLNIPDPYEQISIAELRNPPPENEPPVATFNLPTLRLVETSKAPPGK